MKKILAIGLIVAASTAFARKEDQWIRHQCTAKGNKNGATKVVQGWTRDSVSEARQSALNMCANKGLTDCRIKACYERVWN